jgi:hypothetical protein
VESKYVDARMTENLANVAISSNLIYDALTSDATTYSRRLVQILATPMENDGERWVRFRTWMGIQPGEASVKDCAGARCLGHFLYSRDISHFNPTKIPITMTAVAERIANLPPVHQWWLECLTRGQIEGFGTQPFKNYHVQGAGVFCRWAEVRGQTPVSLTDMMEAYNQFNRVGGRSSSLVASLGGFSRQLALACQRRVSFKRTRSGELQPDGSHERQMIFRIPPLEEARQAFNSLHPGANHFGTVSGAPAATRDEDMTQIDLLTQPDDEELDDSMK